MLLDVGKGSLSVASGVRDIESCFGAVIAGKMVRGWNGG
jgi:hypothetical protein